MIINIIIGVTMQRKPQIQVSDRTLEDLKTIKKEFGLASYDVAVQQIINNAQRFKEVVTTVKPSTKSNRKRTVRSRDEK